MDKKTDELMQILRQKPDADHYMDEYQDELLHQSLTEFLEALLDEKGLSKAEVIRGADIDRTYGYQIFDGRHTPTRDKLIRLAFGLHLTVPQTQQLLKTAQMSPLYPRVVRDVLILECLFQGKDVNCCNNSLADHEFEILQ
jgi:transcriptional regulator with XRE-family HTH domain